MTLALISKASLNADCIIRQHIATSLALVFIFGGAWWLIRYPLEDWQLKLMWEMAKDGREPEKMCFFICTAPFEVEIQFQLNPKREVEKCVMTLLKYGHHSKWIKTLIISPCGGFYCAQTSKPISLSMRPGAESEEPYWSAKTIQHRVLIFLCVAWNQSNLQVAKWCQFNLTEVIIK